TAFWTGTVRPANTRRHQQFHGTPRGSPDCVTTSERRPAAGMPGSGSAPALRRRYPRHAVRPSRGRAPPMRFEELATPADPTGSPTRFHRAMTVIGPLDQAARNRWIQHVLSALDGQPPAEGDREAPRS